MRRTENEVYFDMYQFELPINFLLFVERYSSSYIIAIGNNSNLQESIPNGVATPGVRLSHTLRNHGGSNNPFFSLLPSRFTFSLSFLIDTLISIGYTFSLPCCNFSARLGIVIARACFGLPVILLKMLH